mmetsp:Transcript_14620/g.22940  ORF Transcript_14620/g.22940 Transcript_14620/m.22940 type:complete len:699 (-) Transcript_14620:58-2154(-)
MWAFIVALALIRVTRSEVSVAVVANAVDSENAGNPIRKVVTMLQAMQKKVTAEGEKEKELYDKFMCYCQKGGDDLKLSIANSNTKVPQLQSDIEASEAELVQLKEDLKTHQVDRAAAKEAMAKATAIREKDAKAFAKEKATLDADIGALKSAIAAIEKGMSGGFLQTRSASVLRKLVTSADIDDPEREEVIAFLDGQHSEGYVPKSGEITGILKQIEDEMTKSLEEATSAEKEAIANYEELMAAKTKEVEALTRAIEQKSTRVGELGVQIVTMKNDLTGTEAALVEDQKFLADMEKNCALKTKDWDERSKTRAEELVAIAETIKILNDDDALELFKKTLPSSASSAASLVQVRDSEAVLRQKALAAISKAQKVAAARNPDFDFIALAIKGKKIGFEKVLKMIDDMVVHLKKEQVDDDGKREYCGKQLDTADDKKKGLQQTITDEQTAISEATERLATLKDEIKALEVAIKKLDKSVAESSEQRKEEHEEFTELMASDSAAKELLKFAVNRLNKFYNPKLYNPPPKREISFVQIQEHNHKKDAPEPPPETYGEYEKKSESSTGVVSMINLLIKDLDKEMTEAETTEEDSQKDYEEAMKDAAEKRMLDSKSLTEKTATKARVETELQEHKDGEVGATKELMATEEYIGSLHTECDWLLKYYDVRKEARASEIDALGQAKAVLSGADFSFAQTKKAFMAKA